MYSKFSSKIAKPALLCRSFGAHNFTLNWLFAEWHTQMYSLLCRLWFFSFPMMIMWISAKAINFGGFKMWRTRWKWLRHHSTCNPTECQWGLHIYIHLYNRPENTNIIHVRPHSIWLSMYPLMDRIAKCCLCCSNNNNNSNNDSE